MLLPSSMRINDPFSMKLEKVETPPAPAKLTPQQEFEQLNHDDPAHPTERRLFFEGHDHAALAEMWRFANSRFSKPMGISPLKIHQLDVFEDKRLRHVEAVKNGPPVFFGVDLASDFFKDSPLPAVSVKRFRPFTRLASPWE